MNIPAPWSIWDRDRSRNRCVFTTFIGNMKYLIGSPGHASNSATDEVLSGLAPFGWHAFYEPRRHHWRATVAFCDPVELTTCPACVLVQSCSINSINGKVVFIILHLPRLSRYSIDREAIANHCNGLWLAEQVWDRKSNHYPVRRMCQS